MRKIIFLACFFISVFSRENPFVPSENINLNIITTNIKDKYEEFEKQSIKFPSGASLLLGVRLKYRADDGSIREKTIDLNKTINHKNEYVLSKVNEVKPVVSQKLDVSVTMPDSAMKKPAKKVEVAEAKMIKEPKDTPSNAPILIAKQDINQTNLPLDKIKQEIAGSKELQSNSASNETSDIALPLKSVKLADFIRFNVEANSIKILTKDKIYRHFKHEKNKIVIDFKTQPRFKTMKALLDVGKFKSITMGWHNKFYRVVLNVKDDYKYDLENLKGISGYVVKIK